MSGPRPHVSAVIPVYNEEANLPELNERMTKALDSIGKSWELSYVDEGKPAKSRNRVTKILGGCAVLEEFTGAPGTPWGAAAQCGGARPRHVVSTLGTTVLVPARPTHVSQCGLAT